jgi:hypothetical protein
MSPHEAVRNLFAGMRLTPHQPLWVYEEEIEILALFLGVTGSGPKSKTEDVDGVS